MLTRIQIRKIWLDMSENDINESKDQIQACILNLQLSLHLVNLQATYIAPKIANKPLVDKITEIHKLLTTTKVDKDLQECADIYIKKGTTLYEQSVASSVGGFASQMQPKAIAEWLENMQALRVDELSGVAIVPDDDISSPSISQETEETVPTSMQDPQSASVCSPGIVDDDEDEFAAELVQSTIAAGRKFYAEDKYEEAEARLKECLALMRRLSETHRRGYDFNEIHLLLSLCAFHLHDLATAETALLSALERNTDTIAHATLQFEAGAALAVVYARLKKYDLAELNCENAYRGRRKLFGKEHEACYESLALLAYIYDLQSITARADTYRSMIPKDKQETLRQRCEELLQESNHQTSTEDDSNSQTLEDWTIKLGYEPKCVAISAKGMMLAYGEPSDDWSASIMLQALGSDKVTHTLEVMDDTAATCLAFSPSGKNLASGHGGLWRKGWSRHYRRLSIRVWDTSTGQLLLWHRGSWGKTESLCLNSLAFTPDERQLISTHTWDRETRRSRELMPGYTVQTLATGAVLHQSRNTDLWLEDVSSDSSLIALKSSDSVSVFSMKDYSRVQTLEPCLKGLFNKDNDIAGLIPDDDSIHICMRDSGTEMVLKAPRPASMQGVLLRRMGMAFSTDGNIVISLRQIKGEHIYIAVPQLGLWTAVPAQLDTDSVCKFSQGAEYLMFQNGGPLQCCLKALDIRGQLKLAEKLPLSQVDI